MSAEQTPPNNKENKQLIPTSNTSNDISESSIDFNTILFIAGFILVFVFIVDPILGFVFDFIFALSLSTIISLGILGYALYRRHGRKQEAERKKREMAQKKAEWIKARMAEYDAYHARKGTASSERMGENAAVAGAAGLAGATALNDAMNQGGGAAAATGASGGDAVNNIAAMDYTMRSTEQADHVSDSIRNMEMNRADFEAQLDAEYVAWEAQNLAEDTDMLIGGSGSDGLL